MWNLQTSLNVGKNYCHVSQTFLVCNFWLKHLTGTKTVASPAETGRKLRQAQFLSALLGLSFSQIQFNQTHLSEGHTMTMTLSNRPFTCHLLVVFLNILPKRTGWLLACPCYSLLSEPNSWGSVRVGLELGGHPLWHFWFRKSTSPLECIENGNSLAFPRFPKPECLGDREHVICIIYQLSRAFWCFPEDWDPLS